MKRGLLVRSYRRVHQQSVTQTFSHHIHAAWSWIIKHMDTSANSAVSRSCSARCSCTSSTHTAVWELVTWAVSGESCWSLLLFLACVSWFFLRIMQSNLLLLFLGQPACHLFSVTSAPFVNFLTIHQLCRIELLWGSDAWCSFLCPNKRCVTFCLTSLVSAFCALTTNKLFVMDV